MGCLGVEPQRCADMISHIWMWQSHLHATIVLQPRCRFKESLEPWASIFKEVFQAHLPGSCSL